MRWLEILGVIWSCPSLIPCPVLTYCRLMPIWKKNKEKRGINMLAGQRGSVKVWVYECKKGLKEQEVKLWKKEKREEDRREKKRDERERGDFNINSSAKREIKKWTKFSLLWRFLGLHPIEISSWCTGFSPYRVEPREREGPSELEEGEKDWKEEKRVGGRL